MDDAAGHLDLMGTEAWTDVVRALLGRDDARVTRRDLVEVLVGAGSGTRVLRVAGTAVVGSGPERPWRVVVKVFTPDHADFQSLSDEPSAFDYWKREWSFYRSTWPRELVGSLTAARCWGSGEYTDGEGRLVAWVALEDLGPHERRWPARHYPDVARRAGRFNGWSSTVGGTPEVWWADDWLRGSTEHAADTVAVLGSGLDHDVLGSIITRGFVDDVQALWQSRELAYAALRALPQVLCHNDVFTRNVFVSDGADSCVALDWAFAGRGAVGQELNALIGSSAVFLDSPPGAWEAQESDCLDAYVDGLHEAGWTGSAADVHRGYAISMALRFGVGTMPALAAMTLYPEYYDEVAATLGCRYPEFVTNAAAFIAFIHQRVRRARAELGV